MSTNNIVILGARENNLQNINIEIPRDRIVVITGLSGSGKSSLAFNTIYQEGQRRFLDSLSSYARQFLGQMNRPDVDVIEGLSPTLCIDQKTINRNPRSTVGTITELLGHLRLLFARLGTPHCPQCNDPLVQHSSKEITESLLVNEINNRLSIMAPVILDRKGEYRKELLQARKDGFIRARIDGEIRDLSENIELARYEKHSIELIIDRIKCEPNNKQRVREAIDSALTISGGLISYICGSKYHLLSAQRSCPKHGHAVPEMEPRLFSFNAPQGMCEECNGIGYKEGFVIETLFDQKKNISKALIPLHIDERIPFSHLTSDIWKMLLRKMKIPFRKRWSQLSDSEQRKVLFGCPLTYSYTKTSEASSRKTTQKYWKGLIPILEDVWTYGRLKRLREHRQRIECPSCLGARLNPIALSVRFRNHTIENLTLMSIEELANFFSTLQLEKREQAIGRPIIREINNRLQFLLQVGLGYLNLHRKANTLSGGESQRIRLASQVGSGLQGVTYILDEPSIGLHQRDQSRLLGALEELRNKGNSILIVEHDPMTMSRADHLIEIGPGAGLDGGKVVQSSSRGHFLRSKAITAQYLRGEKGLSIPLVRRAITKKRINVQGVSGHNLKNIDVSFPLECLIVITGVSGSGKSTLIEHTLCPIIAKKLYKSDKQPQTYKKINGLQHIDKLISIDQSPIGRSPRSNPATYTNLMIHIRDLFAQTLEAKRRGYTKSRFSFNLSSDRAGGRCEFCEGAGANLIEMHFLSDVLIECDSCNGKRFNQDTLDIRYKGNSISDVLALTIDEASKVFANQPKILRILNTLLDVGLGYLTLGQQSNTLSGGEAQRIKLAKELHKPASGSTLYVLDEPSTGLHMADVENLVNALQILVNKGNTVIVIEHDLDIIKMADHIIDLGPEGGNDGGRIVGIGTPEYISSLPTHTGKALHSILEEKNNYYSTVLFKGKLNRRVRANDIEITGACIHNLKSINVSLPKGKLNVITGPSGSGKSSLAFHTLFAEGQRRYIESLSTYARRFLGRMQKPPIEKIEGLAPAIAIDQRNRGYSPRSTVATTTEIHDLFRLLFARVGTPHCPLCNTKLKAQPSSAGAIVLQKASNKAGWLVCQLSSEIVAGELIRNSLTRILEKGKQRELDDDKEILNKPIVIIDRFNPSKTSRQRLSEGLDSAYTLGQNIALFIEKTTKKTITLTRDHRCVNHGMILPEDLTPRHFSFNTRAGACTNCQGLGQAVTIEFDRLFPEQNNPIWKAMHGWARVSFTRNKRTNAILQELFSTHKIPFNTIVKKWPKSFRKLLMYGSEQVFTIQFTKRNSNYTEKQQWDGFVPRINAWNNDAAWLRSKGTCPFCNGSRLRQEVLSVTLADINIHTASAHTISEALAFWTAAEWSQNQSKIVEQPLKELLSRLHFLQDVGVGYLQLNRSARSISGGESQRIRLATQLGSHLTQTIYVLDEPTVGLHPKDTQRLLETLIGLKKLNNTLVIVEHDPEVIKAADHIIDLGPAAGEYGGQVIATGSPEEIIKTESNTGQYLSKRKVVSRPAKTRKLTKWITINNFSRHNLNSVSVKFPRKSLTVVTGVSGSGKSTLVFGALKEKIEKIVQKKSRQSIQNLLIVDQSPIGRSPRSTPATYCDIMDPIRKLFAQAQESKRRGWKVGNFTYNGRNGRCPFCEGKGASLVEMHFISDIWITCDHCDGSRYNEATLEITWNKLNIANVLSLSVSEAKKHFINHRSIRNKLQALEDVGLGYLHLGQPSTELSGGEAQRLRLAKQLAKGTRSPESCLLLDEPTTGLHYQDVEILLTALHQLVDAGHMVVVIEHNLDVMWNADFLIDLGPEGGDKGGSIILKDNPTEIIKSDQHLISHTGHFLYKSKR
jgi:excinuclease ABC subunit A